MCGYSWGLGSLITGESPGDDLEWAQEVGATPSVRGFCRVLQTFLDVVLPVTVTLGERSSFIGVSDACVSATTLPPHFPKSLDSPCVHRSLDESGSFTSEGNCPSPCQISCGKCREGALPK